MSCDHHVNLTPLRKGIVKTYLISLLTYFHFDTTGGRSNVYLPEVSLGLSIKNTILTAKMAIKSRDEFKRILQIEKINLDLEEKGIMHLCDNEVSLKHGRKVNKWLAEAGLDRKEVTLDEMLSIEPTLNLKNFVGGFYTKSDMS